MKIPQPFTIYDLRFTISKKSRRGGLGSARVPRASSGVAPELSSSIISGISTAKNFAGRGFWRDAKNHTRDACAPRHSSRVTRHREQGIALVITLIMLAVTLVMAVAFLALARRERGRLTTVTDTTTAQLAADSGVANAEAQIAANMLYGTLNGSSSNAFNLHLLVSTNYINPAGFDPAPNFGSPNPTNVNYDHLLNSSTLLSADQRNQNIANLFFLPRPPVAILTNQAFDFRFYLDLNENAKYDQYGSVPQIGPAGGFLHPDGTEDNNPVNVVTNLVPGGDPEWVGVLEHPDQPHGPNNHFLSRYAFIALPVGNTLDLNAIHNEAKNLQVNPGVPATIADSFFRNQGVGSWEINLAAFLADLNTNIWGQDINVTANFYQYNEALSSPFANKGVAFDDARALLSYRYNFNYRNLAPANTVFFNAGNMFPIDGIDAYCNGPLQTTLNTNADWIPDIPGNFWVGANNPNFYFTPGDFFDASKVQAGIAFGFTNRLRVAGNNPATYDRYTYYRMLDQLGTDSTVESGKLNLNYSNAVVSYANINGVFVVTGVSVVAGAETNLVKWNPQNFFLAAADQLLRTYSAQWFASDPTNFLATYYGTIPRGYLDATGLGVTNLPYFGQTNQIPMLSITNIPVMVGSNFVYSPAVHRLLQLAANLYDATTNINNNLPHVFRPVFERVNNNGDIHIVGYLPVTFVSGTTDPQLAPPYDVTQLSAVPLNTPILNRPPNPPVPVNVYGVPWIIGAKKDLPGFNQFHMINSVTVTRKLQVSRTTTDPVTAIYTTNQMYVIGISNSVGISFWNSYSNAYVAHNGGQLTIYASDVVYMTLTNNANNGTYSWSGQTNLTINNLPLGVGYTTPAWPGSHWSGTPPNATPRANSFFTNNWGFNFIVPSVYRFNSATFVPADTLTGSSFETTVPPLRQLPPFGLAVTNYLQAFVLDGNNVIDYVQLRDPVSIGNLNPVLATEPYPPINNQDLYDNWFTNYYVPNNAASPPRGVMNQLWVSGHPGSAPAVGGQWSTTATVIPGDTTPPAEAAFFNGFFTPTFQYAGQTYRNDQPAVQAPYTPTRTIFSSYLLQANDPLVHTVASDLNSQAGAVAIWAAKAKWNNGVWNKINDPINQPMPTPPTTPIGGRYQPWGQSKQMEALSGVDTNAYHLGYRDPLAWGSDNWDFPTNLYPTVGWIGRVHRGTPWQTVDLKSTNILFGKNSLNQNIGTNTWANWTGDLQKDYSGRYFDAVNSAPAGDRLLFDIFTTRFSDNAVRGTLPINQSGLAAWSALFSGMVALSNSAPNNVNAASDLTYLNLLINPAGVDVSNSPIWQIINGTNGINATRANTNLFTSQVFTHLGDLLQTPALTERSPFLDLNTAQSKYGISDELYEWLPQQMMGLVRLGETRYVLYVYGQALRPAPGGTVLSGPFFQLVTNYSVVAESAVRAVIRVDGANTKTPHAVVESYNVLPPN